MGRATPRSSRPTGTVRCTGGSRQRTGAPTRSPGARPAWSPRPPRRPRPTRSTAARLGCAVAQWHPVDYATRYAVEVYKNGDVLFSSDNLSADTKFAAWAADDGSRLGRLRVAGAGPRCRQPPRPVVGGERLPPLAGSALTSPHRQPGSRPRRCFGWTASLGAIQYRWQLSPNAAFNPSPRARHRHDRLGTASPPSPTAGTSGGCRPSTRPGTCSRRRPDEPCTKDTVAPTVTEADPDLRRLDQRPVHGPVQRAGHGVTAGTFRVTVAGTSRSSRAWSRGGRRRDHGDLAATSSRWCRGRRTPRRVTTASRDPAGNPLTTTVVDVRRTPGRERLARLRRALGP